MNDECINHCKFFATGCRVSDPRNVQGSLQTGTFCRHSTCEHGMNAAKRVQNLGEFRPMMTSLGQANLAPFNTTQKHGDGMEYQRYVSSRGNLFSLGTDGNIYSTGQQTDI